MDAVMVQLLPPPPPGIEHVGGFVFICDHFTVQESFRRMTFGLPQEFTDAVVRIRPGLPLFIFDTDTHSLHGVFVATSHGGVNLDPLFCPNINSPGSLYPAQVRFNFVFEHLFLPPLPRYIFQRVVTYYGPLRFCLLLTTAQAQLLMEVLQINRRINIAIARNGAW